MRCFKLILPTILALICSMWVAAQQKSIGIPQVKNYLRTEYRGGTQNWGIDQDQSGTIYFANNSGLLQFTGNQWNVYPVPRHSSVRCLKVASDGRIYVGSYNEFGYFAPDNKGKLRYQSLLHLVHEENRDQIDFIWKLHLFNNEVVFQSFDRAYIYDGKKLRILEAPNKFQFSFVADERLFFQDAAVGLLEYSNKSLTPLPDTKKLNGSEIWGIFSLSEDALLISTLDRGMFKYEKDVLLPWETEAGEFVKKNNGLGGTRFNKNHLALNTVLDGVIVCDANGKIIQHVNRRKGLENNTVLASFVDSGGSLWLGLDNGISFLNENSPFSYFGLSYGISTVYASAVHDGRLYVATNQGLFWHTWAKPFRENAFELVEGTTGQAWNIQVVEGQLFCGHNRGLMVIEGSKAVRTLDRIGYWSVKPIPGSDLLIGSNYSGFSVFERGSGGWQLRNKIEGMDKSSANYEVEERNVWLKKDDLLYLMKLNHDFTKFRTIKIYRNLSEKTRGISTVQRFGDTVYFQTDNRFYTYLKDQDRFVANDRFTKYFKGIPPIRSALEDNGGNIWFVFGESIGMLRKEGRNFIQSVEPFANLTGNLMPDYPSVNFVSNTDVFIGLTSGLAHYDMTLRGRASKRPSVFIRSFSNPHDTLVVSQLKKRPEIDIAYRDNSVRFTFSSPQYGSLEQVEFSYMLSGLEDQWSRWSNIPFKEYTNLHEGDYTMRVRARTRFGVESVADSLAFEVAPPWFRHPVSYILYLCLITAGIAITRRRIRMQIRRNKYYETIEQRRIYLEREAKIRQEQFELEKEIERLKNERLQTKILSKDKELVSNSLQVVKKNKVLNGIIHKLKDINTDTLDEETKFQFNKLNKSIVKEVNADKSWQDLEKHIRNVHFEFLKRLKERFPTISPRELDLATYLLMNMSTKEIAEIMNISKGGVELARYRLRKKMGLNNKENLTGFLMSI